MTDDDSHTITAIEPVWTGELYRPSTESGHDPASKSDVYAEYVGPADFDDTVIDSMLDQSEYECRCGEEFDSWAQVEEHVQEVACTDDE